jgi:enoyl-CoA hydratase
MARRAAACKADRLAIEGPARSPFATWHKAQGGHAGHQLHSLSNPNGMTMSDENEPSGEEPVLIERRGPVLWLTLNRPHRLNAVSLPLYRGLVRALAEVDEDVRVVVLTGAGRAFCAGADLKAHAEQPLTAKQRRSYVRAAQRANLLLQRGPRPVIAAVNGPAIGGGLELALSCDFIVVASDARLRLPEIALGTFVGGGVTYTLPERVGMARARELLLLGEFFTGEQAEAMGLANRAVAAARVQATALEMAGKLAAMAPVSMTLARRLLRRARRMSRRQLLEAEARALETCMSTDDWREGVIAHREKRTPRYTGR